jgi:membrane protease YdiL (CAAX protease family)
VGGSPTDEINVGRRLVLVWSSAVVIALILLDVLNGAAYGLTVAGGTIALAAITTTRASLRVPHLVGGAGHVDRRDLLAVLVLYVAAVGAFRLAFGVFTTDSVAGLFLTFAAGMLVGVLGPLAYAVWIRGRTLASLGIGLHRWRSTLALGALFAVVQFSLTLLGYDLPAPVDWVPLLVMSVTVGIFEAVFFRGFVQGTLERSVGVGPAVLLAAGLYALYHVGYGMGADEMLFLFGLGVVYAIVYRLTENVLILWPLLTPAGSFFNQLGSGDLAGELPWASIAGFANVLMVMAVGIWLTAGWERRTRRRLRATAEGGTA